MAFNGYTFCNGLTPNGSTYFGLGFHPTHVFAFVGYVLTCWRHTDSSWGTLPNHFFRLNGCIYLGASKQAKLHLRPGSDIYFQTLQLIFFCQHAPVALQGHNLWDLPSMLFICKLHLWCGSTMGLHNGICCTQSQSCPSNITKNVKWWATGGKLLRPLNKYIHSQNPRQHAPLH